MGCGGSRLKVVEPSKPGMNKCIVVCDSHRGDSAISKNTTDSGVGLDTGESTVHRILPPLRAQSPGMIQESQRLESSAILEQLLSQGIIAAQSKMGCSGETYNLILDEAGKQRKRPPARLESLKILKEQGVTKKEDLEEKMRQVEKRRKVREVELRNKLRAKSARPREAPCFTDGEKSLSEHDDAFLSLQPPPNTKQSSNEEEADQEPTYSPTYSPELENYSSFEQKKDTDEIF